MIDLPPKTKKWLGRGLKAGGLLLVVGIVAWAAIINPYQIRQEKQRFEAATVSLEELSEEIQTKIGPADGVIQDNSCGRANLKSEKGPLLCNTSYDLIYTNADSKKANQFLENTLPFGTNLRQGSSNLEGLMFTENENKRTPQVLYQDLSSIDGIKCNLGYSYPVSNNFNESDEARYSFTNVFAVRVSCGGLAKIEHFPVKD